VGKKFFKLKIDNLTNKAKQPDSLSSLSLTEDTSNLLIHLMEIIKRSDHKPNSQSLLLPWENLQLLSGKRSEKTNQNTNCVCVCVCMCVCVKVVTRETVSKVLLLLQVRLWELSSYTPDFSCLGGTSLALHDFSCSVR
jgi:hypothetical protein